MQFGCGLGVLTDDGYQDRDRIPPSVDVGQTVRQWVLSCVDGGYHLLSMAGTQVTRGGTLSCGW